MTHTSDKRSHSSVVRASSGTSSLPVLPVLLALAACGGRYELGEVSPLDPSESSGAGSSGFEPSAPRAIGHVIIDEPGDLDAPLSRSLENPVGDIDGDGYDDWFASPSNSRVAARGEFDLALVYGGPRIEGDLYRDDRLGPIVTYETQTHLDHWRPSAAGDVDGDGFGDVLVTATVSIVSGYPDWVKSRFLDQWGEQQAYILYGGPRGASPGQIRLSEAAVPFAPLEAIRSSFGPEQVLAADPDAVDWTADQQMLMTSLGDLDSDGFDDFAYTHSVTWRGTEIRGDSEYGIPVWTDAVTYVFYGGTNRLSAENPTASAAAVLPGVTAMDRIGDIDGDGQPDLVAKKNDQVYLVPGGVERVSGTLAVEQVGAALLPPDGKEDGWVNELREVVGVGDLDDDGFDDLMVTRWAPLANATLLFYGSAHRFEQPLLDESADATVLMDEQQSTQLVQRLGDWNGDGHEDLLVVGSYADEGDREQGWRNPYSKAVVILGGSERYSGVLSAGMLATAPDQRSVAGYMMLRPLGDVDGDGRVDLQVWREALGLFVKYGSSFESIIIY
jgi:hypothetical protein